MKVAIVHDWLVTYGGAERVLEQVLKLFPDADLFALYDFIPPGKRDFILDKPVATSFLQRLPLARRKYRSYLPLMPLAIEQFDLSSYNLIISNSFCTAKGVITGPDQLHISYVNSPVRYAWDLTHQYLREAGLQKGIKSWLARWILHRIRLWDVRTANGVDEFICNSEFIARRIWKVYRRRATVINPPVDAAAFELGSEKQDFYLTASRMVPYKKIDLIVEAFSLMSDKRLIVIGDGPDFRKVRRKAGPNVTLMGYQPFEILKDHMQRASAFVFAAEEDFGIIPLEAQACGTPVIAYGKGGSLETVIKNETGLYFYEQTPEKLIDAVNEFEKTKQRFNPKIIRRHAEKFSPQRFRKEFKGFVDRAIARYWVDSTEKRRLFIKRLPEAVGQTEGVKQAED